MDEKELKRLRSLERARESTTSLAKIMARGAAEVALPVVGGVVYDLGERLIAHGRDWRSDRQRSRLHAFLEAVLKGDDLSDSKEFLEKDFEVDTFDALVSSVLNDLESNKIPIYARLFRALVDGRIEQEYKTHFLRAVKELSLDDIELMRQLYIRFRFQLKDYPDRETQLRTLLQNRDPLKGISIQNLARLGFLTPALGAVTPLNYEMSDVLRSFVEAAIDHEQLTPKSIGCAEWTELFAFIAMSGKEKDEVLNCLTEVGRLLFRLNIKSTIAQPRGPFLVRPDMIFFSLTREVQPGDLIEFAKKFADATIFKLCFESEATGALFDPIPEVSGHWLDFREDKRSAYERLAFLIKNSILSAKTT